MTQHDATPQAENPNNEVNEFVPYVPLLARTWFRLLLLALVGMVLVLFDWMTALRVVSVEMTDVVDARGGEIVITFDKPVEGIVYRPSDKRVAVSNSLTDDNTQQVITLRAPTPYNIEFELAPDAELEWAHGKVLGLFPLEERFKVLTSRERVWLDTISPAEGSKPVPDAMRNQIVLNFKGTLGGEREKGNILPENLDFIRM